MLDGSSTDSTAAGTSLSPAALTTADPGDEVLLAAGSLGATSAQSWSVSSGLTAEAQADATTGISSLIADEPGPQLPGSTGTATATASHSAALGGVLLALEPATATSSTLYDADGEAVLATDPDGDASLTCYDGDGQVSETVPPVGVFANALSGSAVGLSASSCAYSNLYPSGYLDGGNELDPTSLASDATLTTYDANGDKISVTTPAPAGQSSPQVTTYDYDPAGQLTTVTAPPASPDSGAPSQVTTTEYDADGQVISTTTGAGTADASTTVYCYDPNGDRSAVVAPDGNTGGDATCSGTAPYDSDSPYETAYTYDSAGELFSQTTPVTSADPDGGVTSYAYDAAGNQVSLTEPDGVVVTSAYSPLNKVTSISYSGSSAHSVDYSYDANGAPTGMVDASGTSSYTYDPFGELTAQTNGAGKTIDYAYNSLGEQTSITYPLGSGATWATSDAVSYSYDPAGRLTSLSDFAGNTVPITYTQDGLPATESLGTTGDTLTTSYDSTDAPSEINLANGSTLLDFTYTRAPSGDIAQESDTPSSSLSPASYDYTAQGRLTSDVAGSSATNSYSEDASGNLTALPTGATATYDDASELVSSTLGATTTSYTYDENGERTGASVGGSSTESAAYNGAGEMTSFSNSAADLSSATYDGNGLRSADTVTPSGGSASTQHFVWDTTASVPELLMDGSNAYVYAGGGAPIEQVELSSGTVHYLVDDALGSVRGVVDSSGAVVATASYDAWGNAESGSDVAGYTSFGFAGGYTDGTGLLYLIHRYYDPTTGQFLTVDPDLQRTQEPFTYTTDDPVNNVDPLGLYNKLRTIASGYFFGYYEALNQVTTGRGKNVKPGMVRIQYQITALGPTIADTVIITGRIQNLTHPELGIQVDSTPPDITLQPTAHPSVLAYPGDKILANGTATQLDGTLVLFVGSCVAPAAKVKSRGTQFPGAVGASGVSGTGPTGASGVPGTGP